MEYIDEKAVEQLLTEEASPKVTIYLPVHTSASPPHLTENQIRLKNLFNTAREQLPKHGAGKQLADDLHDALQAVYDNLKFWEQQTPSLLICASPGSVRMFHIAIDTEPFAIVDEQYHLAPILGLMNDTRRYYVLAIAQKDPVIYEGDLHQLQASSVQLPANAETALGIDEANQRTEHQGSVGTAGRGMNGFNGRGGARDPEPSDRARYFRKIDAIISDKLDQNTHLLLAGTETDIALYRRVSRYPRILKSELHGNFTTTAPKELLGKASSLIWKELIEPDHEAAIQRFERLRGSGTDQTAVDEVTIKKAAGIGRVETLLASLLRRTSDTVQDSLHEVLRITFPPAELCRSLNQLAVEVWRNQGRVLCLEPQKMPVRGNLAASLRY